MDRHSLLEALQKYDTPFGSERQFIPRFLELLQHPKAYHRDLLPGHMTGSAWIVDQRHNRVLLAHHAKLNKWLQPGGHADGDENILSVARREATEETGLTSLSLADERVFDVDIHTIPARGNLPEHLHFDIRFAFHADSNETVTITHESHALAWVDYQEVGTRVNNNPSILRMLEKTRILPRTN
jgi:8-oxo-dGTP pyrophosphatase MutT (NUDIX family)